MKREDGVLKNALLRRRIHKSWKITMIVALLGWFVFGFAGLINGAAGFLLVLLLLLVRPLAEVAFSRMFYCPHCDADVFLEVCLVESRGAGVEHGVKCAHCGRDATQHLKLMDNVVDID